MRRRLVLQALAGLFVACLLVPAGGQAARPYTVGVRSLERVCPGLTGAQATVIARSLGAAMHRYHVVTRRRAAAFVAQTAHESACYRFSAELWGPTPVQASYWHRRDLGNWRPFHGFRYRGRGYIQITGLANYRAVGRALRRNFLRAPQLLATPAYAAASAAWWWAAHGCNQLADTGSVIALTRRINGGTNGLADRVRLHRIASRVARYLVPRRR